jgi:hypothetical protein
MEETKAKRNIYESMTAILGDVDAITKDKKTESGSIYKYRGVDQVLNTLHPLFAKYKVFCIPEVLEVVGREDRTTSNDKKVIYSVLRVKYTFFAEDGSSVSAIVMGEGMDSGDKSMNKCMSVAFKYACFQTLCIPTEETTQDPDDDNQTFANENKPKISPAKPENKKAENVPKKGEKTVQPTADKPLPKVKKTEIVTPEEVKKIEKYGMGWQEVVEYCQSKFAKEPKYLTEEETIKLRDVLNNFVKQQKEDEQKENK